MVLSYSDEMCYKPYSRKDSENKQTIIVLFKE